jgi:hypothetical protein
MEAYEAAEDTAGIKACLEENRGLLLRFLQDLPLQLDEDVRIRREHVIYEDVRALRRYARDLGVDIAPLDPDEVEACRAHSVPIPEARMLYLPRSVPPEDAMFFGELHPDVDVFAAETPETAVSVVEFRRAWSESGKGKRKVA